MARVVLDRDHAVSIEAEISKSRLTNSGLFTSVSLENPVVSPHHLAGTPVQGRDQPSLAGILPEDGACWIGVENGIGTRERNMIQSVGRSAGLLEYLADRVDGCSPVVLAASDPFFFHRVLHHTVFDQRGGRVMAIVDTEDFYRHKSGSKIRGRKQLA